MDRHEFISYLRKMGYDPIKVLPNGEIAGVRDYLFTASISVGLNEFTYRTRFCYETRVEAEGALFGWDGKGDPPGKWIKQKPEERTGPWFEEPK